MNQSIQNGEIYKVLICFLRSEFEQLKNDFIVQVCDGNIGIYHSNLGAKNHLVFELNDERINKSELDTIVATGLRNGSGNMRIRGVLGKPAEFCIEIESNPSKCHQHRNGDQIDLFHNNVVKATIPRNFEKFSFCLPFNYVDIKNDEFKLRATGNNDVS